MKKILFLFILITQISFSQNEVVLKINHLLGTNPMDVNLSVSNNLNQKFNLSRVQYYMSEITITHDNNQVTTLIDTWILVDGLETTEINLGSFDIDSVESFTFSIGVDFAHNHLDPSTYPIEHPLAPKSPSLHWGWTDGYRFVAIEGNTGVANTFNYHAFGDNLYYSQSLDYIETGAENNKVIIQINADYIQTVKDLDVISSFKTHANETDPITVKGIDNFRNHVFSAKEGSAELTSISTLKNTELKLFPNPTTGNISISGIAFDHAVIYNAIGEKVKTISSNSTQTNLERKGIYFIHFHANNKAIAIKKILVY